MRSAIPESLKKEMEAIGQEKPVETKQETAQNEAEELAEVKKFGKELAKEKKVRVKIKDKNKRDVSAVPVGINGYFITINKDETVEVPETVAKVLEEGGYI